MKKIALLLVCAFSTLLMSGLIAQTCNNTIFTDGFSSNTGWTSVGSGLVNISGGTLNFQSAPNGNYNKVYKSLGTTLSDSYWKAEFDFSIISSNPSGYGTGEVLIALTAGTQDFQASYVSGTYTETNQDAIALVLYSNSYSDNNINNWQFLIEAKKGNVRTYSSSPVYASSAYSNYYIRLERTANNMTQLSIFSDPSFTNQIGSYDNFVIDPTITGLNTIQHGVCTPGISSRTVNGILDNDNICDDSSVTGTASLESTVKDKVLIFPNPTTGIVNISGISEGTAIIFNSIGQTVEKKKVTDMIDISSYPSGIYFVQLLDAKDKIVSTHKLLKD